MTEHAHSYQYPVVKTPYFHSWHPGSIPGQGIKIPQATYCREEKKINSPNKYSLFIYYVPGTDMRHGELAESVRVFTRQVSKPRVSQGLEACARE